MVAMHKKDEGGKVARLRIRKAYFYCIIPSNSSNLEINNITLKEHLMLDHIQKHYWSYGKHTAMKKNILRVSLQKKTVQNHIKKQLLMFFKFVLFSD